MPSGQTAGKKTNLDAGDGRALQRGHQDPAQRVAEGQAEAPLERFGDHGRHARGIGAGTNVELGRLDQLGPILVDHACPSIPVCDP